MGDQIGGVVCCSSSIIFGSCCDGGLWLGQGKYVPFSITMGHLEAVNHYGQVILLQPLKVWHYRGVGVGYGV